MSALDGLLRGFDGFVTYNGTGFDLPLLETRFVLARLRGEVEQPARRDMVNTHEIRTEFVD